MSTDLTAGEARAQDDNFTSECSLVGLQERLPLRWPTPADTPPSPKKRYRSHYVYQGWYDLRDPAVWQHLSDFELVLRLLDFSGLRPVLARLLGWTSARGYSRRPHPLTPGTTFPYPAYASRNLFPRGAYPPA